jgi:peroxiredoxin
VANDVEGKRVNLSDTKRKAIVLVFVAHDCPISNAYAPEVNHLAARYSRAKMAFYLVYPARGLKATEARRHAREYGYQIPLLMDPTRRLVKRAQVHVTPEVAVLTPQGRLLYRGRIDDRYAVLGKPRLQATRHDLRAALDSISAGKIVQTPRTTAIGCYIEG